LRAACWVDRTVDDSGVLWVAQTVVLKAVQKVALWVASTVVKWVALMADLSVALSVPA
jgi:hypothetical protein